MSAGGWVAAGAVVVVGGVLAVVIAAPAHVQSALPFTRASSLKRACEQGADAPCGEILAMYERDGAGVSAVDNLATAGCQASSSAACTRLVERASSSTEAMAAAAAAALLKSCAGKALGCAALVADASKPGSTVDSERLRAVSGHGCDDNQLPLCQTLGLLLDQGKGGPADARGARRALEKACERGKLPGACERASDMQAVGEGGPKDMAAAARNGAVACEDRASACWNAAEYAELVAWEQCAPSLVIASAANVRAGAPLLEQSETTRVSFYTTPDRYEHALKERGIFTREHYVETTRFPGQTYQTSTTEVDRYASAALGIDNASCAPIHVSASLVFSFGAWDSIKRGALAGIATFVGGRLLGADKDDAADGARRAFAAGATRGLRVRGELRVQPRSKGTLVLEVDTQSLFGNNRKMEGVNIEQLDVSFPSGKHCKPECARSLKDLSGPLEPVRAQYKRSCEVKSQACEYLRAIDAQSEGGLSKACNGGKSPNFEGACRRRAFADWLH